MPLLSLPSGRIDYDERGAGVPLVLLSANPGDRRDFDAVLPELESRFRVRRLDWPGYGASPAPQPPSAASAMLFARILRELVEALALPPAVFLCNSVGCYAAVRLALDQPQRVRALLLVSPGGFSPQNAVTRTFCRIKGNEAVTRATNVSFAKFYLRRRSPVVLQMLARAGGEQRTPAAVAVNAAVWRSFALREHDLRAAARAVAAPTLVVNGRHDPVLPPRDGAVAAKAIPGAQHVVLDTGHAPFAEDPPLFLQAVLPFLQGVSA